MKILHYCHKSDKDESLYIDTLSSAMCGEAENMACKNFLAFRKTLKTWKPDIVHLHGCWHLSIALACRAALKNGARVVVSPHGKLEPWVLKQKRFTEKLPKTILYQRRCIGKAYAIITFGRMEAGFLKELGYNPRIEVVLNSIVTNSISSAEMAAEVFAIYRKVMDSDITSLMQENTKLALRAIVKAGLSGDPQWLDAEESEAIKEIAPLEWHKISVFSCQEDINQTIEKGIAVTQLSGLAPLYTSICSYDPPLPDDLPALFGKATQDNEGSFIAALKLSKKLLHAKSLRMRHLIELSDNLRHTDYNEGLLAKKLTDSKLAKFASQLMYALSATTGLEEGFMPLPAKGGWKAKKIIKRIIKHTKI